MVLNPPDDTVITRHPLAEALAKRDSVPSEKQSRGSGPADGRRRSIHHGAEDSALETSTSQVAVFGLNAEVWRDVDSAPARAFGEAVDAAGHRSFRRGETRARCCWRNPLWVRYIACRRGGRGDPSTGLG
jgi:hypothetical protein